MGIYQLGELALNYTKALGKHSILQTKPQALTKLDTVGLKYAPKIEGDVVQFSNKTFRKLSPEQSNVIMEREGLQKLELLDKSGENLAWGCLEKELITENNSIFLEELTNLYPKLKSETVNTELQKMMLYLRDIDHSNSKNKKDFLNKFINDVKEIGKMTAQNGELLYQESAFDLFSKKALLDAKYNDKETYKDIMDLYKLYKEGKAPKYVFGYLFPEAKMHALPKSDMQKILRGESYYPKLSTLSEPNISKLETGEAFSVGKEMYVKTSTGYDKLKIDAETYEKLFPPIERYTLAQGTLGNCHLMATIDAITKNPESRIDLYKMFEQVEGGVKCTIKAYPEKGIIYKLDDMESLYGEFNVSSSPANRMLEKTYADNYYDTCVSGMFSENAIKKAGDNHLKIFKDGTDSDEIEMYIEELIGKKAKSPSNADFKNEKWPINSLNIANNSNGAVIAHDRGICNGHFYNVGDLEKGTIINPWNTMFEIPQNPFALAEITHTL